MMHESLDRFIDDYIERLLAWIDHIETDESLDPLIVHDALLGQLSEAKGAASGGPWDPAVYALASLTDELMLETPWAGRSWWNDHVFEVILFGTRRCSDRFFLLANEAAHNRDNGMLRVFHDCVLLGFRGVYAIPELGESLTRELGIPPTVDQWMIQTQQRLTEDASPQNRERFHRRLTGASPNPEKKKIVLWTVAACTLMLANVAALRFFR